MILFLGRQTVRIILKDTEDAQITSKFNKDFSLDEVIAQ